MSDSTTSKMITLMSSDGTLHKVPETVAKQSKRIRQIIGDLGTEKAIPLTDVTGSILEKVIEFCKEHVEAAERLRNWEDKFFSEKHTNMVFELCKAAEYLDIEKLQNAADRNVCDRIIPTGGDNTEEELGVTWKDKLPPDEKEEEA